ncbi:Oxidoreductase, short-chain dehydrogenase/reductase family [Euzebya pacifica]|uniref:Oxidoreductase, short-chain dehydrogenase/reductase family n=1 Tax=Euzebya pacifica TaxID=1608957 RepID=A0A346Y2U6_9ACTN|nr:SDR family NAD(P)-dependent oxidoreductase [Euzebya pacifica]AXV08793.1 Oxidoreductase, short-chain dehydrogenase/reductase family [Euzebya pacifica]
MTVSHDFGGRVALVTGAGGDIGRAVAVRLAGAGATVVLADLASRADAVEDTARRCRDERTSARVHTVAFDVTSASAVDAALAEVPTDVGPPDLLFNNAGYQGRFLPVGEYPPDDAARVLAVNVVGVLNVLQAFVRSLRADGRGGAVVNTASMAGVGGAANMPAYAASKAAVIGLTRAAALDLAPHGIRVNAVSPAFIGPGEMWDRQVAEQAAAPSQYYADDPATVEQQMIGQVPLRRVGSVEEVAGVVAWLLSADASYVTGENILVTGGIG